MEVVLLEASQRIKRGLRRHRKAILLGTFAGIFIAGGIKVHRLYRSALDQLNEADQRAMKYRKRQEHCYRVSKESSQAMICFISSLNDAIEKQFIQMKSIVVEIKSLRVSSKTCEISKQKLHQQWDTLTVLSFSKVLQYRFFF